MAKYLIAYDLVGTDETSADYDELIKQIKSYPTWAKIQKSVWAIKSSKSASSLFDELNAHLDSNDRLFIVSLKVEAHWKNSICESDALKKLLESG